MDQTPLEQTPAFGAPAGTPATQPAQQPAGPQPTPQTTAPEGTPTGPPIQQPVNPQPVPSRPYTAAPQPASGATAYTAQPRQPVPGPAPSGYSPQGSPAVQPAQGNAAQPTSAGYPGQSSPTPGGATPGSTIPGAAQQAMPRQGGPQVAPQGGAYMGGGMPSPPPGKSSGGKKGGKVAAIVLAVVLVLALAGNAVQYALNAKTIGELHDQLDYTQGELAGAREMVAGLEGDLKAASEEADELNDEVAMLQEENDRLSEQLASAGSASSGGPAEAFLSATVFISMTGMENLDSLEGVLYHTYDCPQLDPLDYLGMSAFIALLEGMEPCPECHH